MLNFTKVSLCLQLNSKQNTIFQFSLKVISNKMHEAISKLVKTQKQYVNRSHRVVVANSLVGIFLKAENPFC